jgi:hypothetical protein
MDLLTQLNRAMHEIIGEEFKYVPGNVCGYVGGGYTIDKDGTVTGVIMPS